jgi:hypothetical protein
MNLHLELIHMLEQTSATTMSKEYHHLIERLRTLDEKSPLEHVLGIYREIRKAGILPEHITFFLILRRLESLIEPMIEEQVEQADAMYRERKWELEALIQATIREFTATHPLPVCYVQELLEDMLQEDIDIGEQPPSMTDIEDQARTRTVPEQLRLFGEPEMAKLFEADQIQFERMRERGRQAFFGPETDPIALKLKRERGVID